MIFRPWAAASTRAVNGLEPRSTTASTGPGGQPLDEARLGDRVGHELDACAGVLQDLLRFRHEVLRCDEDRVALHRRSGFGFRDASESRRAHHDPQMTLRTASITWSAIKVELADAQPRQGPISFECNDGEDQNVG